MIVRCISEQEATALVQSRPITVPAPDKTAKVEPKPSEQPGDSQPAAPPSDDGKDQRSATLDVDVNVGPVVADKGNLTGGKLNFKDAKEKYLQCVKDNGGLQGKSGEVQVRFLVRERGRAEGVSVAKRSSVTIKAAQCIADVVDRRYVGIPGEAVVGATVTVKFDKR
jgi:hypothetical protein